MSSQAEDSLVRFTEYVANEQQSPINAERWWRNAIKTIDSLTRFPHRCPPSPENEFRDYEIIRMILLRLGLILFSVDELAKIVRVIGFRHGSQLPWEEELPDQPA